MTLVPDVMSVCPCTIALAFHLSELNQSLDCQWFNFVLAKEGNAIAAVLFEKSTEVSRAGKA